MKGRDKLISFIVLIIIILCITTVNFYREASKQRELLNQQRAAYMELEEEMLKLSSKNADLEQEIIELKDTLNQEKANCKVNYDALQQKLLDLKEKLKAVTMFEGGLQEE